MFCEKCGSPMPDTANFCEKCGTRINKEDIKFPHNDITLDKGIADSDKTVKTGKYGKYIVIACVVVFMLITGSTAGVIISDNIKEHRLKTQINLGHKYMAELNYEAALLAFEEAIRIDPNSITAYEGGITAYKNMNETTEFASFYENAMKVVNSMDEQEVSDNIGAVVSIYMAADNVYGDESKETLENYDKAEELAEKYKSADAYIAIAKSYEDKNKYNDAIEVINKGAEKVGESELKNYKDELIQENAERQSKAFAKELLEPLYELFEKNDVNGVIALLKTDKYQLLATVPFAGDRICWSKQSDNGEINGKGIGVYRISEQSYTKHDSLNFGYYVFYYGDYVNGQRSGKGKWVACNGKESYVADGEWNNDRPNGEQFVDVTTKVVGNLVYGYVETGVTVNGLWNGERGVGHKNSEWSRCNFEMGKYVVLYYDESGRAVVSPENEVNGPSYLFEDYDIENERKGILGFAGYLSNTAEFVK